MISVIINCDTRSGFDSEVSEFKGMNQGCVSTDFLVDGLINKRKFFEGFDCEFILYIDEHHSVPYNSLDMIRDLADSVTIRKHTKHYRGQDNFHKFNDINYLAALAQARGDIIVHFDQDTAAFTSDPKYVDKLLKLILHYNFVSYPSRFSPDAVNDPSFDHKWVSTRFFATTRPFIDFTELERCIFDPEYMWEKYGDKKRKLSWLEHVLGITNNADVYYPPIETDKYMIFCWNKYIKGTLGKLNQLPYKKVVQYVEDCGGIHFPNDVTAK